MNLDALDPVVAATDVTHQLPGLLDYLRCQELPRFRSRDLLELKAISLMLLKPHCQEASPAPLTGHQILLTQSVQSFLIVYLQISPTHFSMLSELTKNLGLFGQLPLQLIRLALLLVEPLNFA